MKTFIWGYGLFVGLAIVLGLFVGPYLPPSLHWMSTLINYYFGATIGSLLIAFLISMQHFGRWLNKKRKSKDGEDITFFDVK